MIPHHIQIHRFEYKNSDSKARTFHNDGDAYDCRRADQYSSTILSCKKKKGRGQVQVGLMAEAHKQLLVDNLFDVLINRGGQMERHSQSCYT